MSIKSHRYGIVRVVLLVVLIVGNFDVRSAKAATLNFGWAQILGTADMDYGSAIAIDENGNVYSTGFLTNIPGNRDFFLTKLDGNGDFLWAKVIGGPSFDSSHAIAVDNDGSVYITGSYSATVDFDPGAGTSNLSSLGSTDIFLSKYDQDGNFLWAKGIGGISNDVGAGIALDGTGNVYFVGWYSDTVDFDPGAGISNLTSGGQNDIFLGKFDGDGNLLWVKGLGGTADDNAYGVAVDGNERVLITGYFTGTVDFDPGPDITDQTSLGDFDIFVSQFDTDGNFIWATQAGGAAGDNGIEIALDGWGDAYVVGYYGQDAFLGKLDGNGNFIWTQTIAGLAYAAGYGIAVDANSDVYFTGDYSGTVDFDNGPDTRNLTSAGYGDIFISKLDRNGNLIWAESLGGPSGDLPDGLAVDGSGNVYLSGSFFETADFDPGSGTSLLTSAGMGDAFIARLSFTPQIHYVKWNATGSNDGTSWQNAYRDLQSALSAASSGDEIWVAAGTYEPTAGTDRTISFVLKDGVAIYGGFSGNETSLAQRDPTVHLTVLSGDLHGDDHSNIETDEPTRAENSLHVVFSDGVGSSAILDGVTITGGNANAAYGTDNSSGGGIWDGNGSPTFTDVIVAGNSARTMGGGMLATNSSSTLTAVTFDNNYSAFDGGGLANYLGSPALTDVVFTENTAGYSGGGLLNAHVTNTTFIDVTFSGNTAFSHGGGMANYTSQFTLAKATFFDNQAVNPLGPTIGEGGGVYNYHSSPVIENTTFYENTGSAIVNFSSGPILTNVTFTKNGDVIVNESSSHPVIRNSIIWGNRNPETGGIDTIIDKNNSSSIVSDSVMQNGFPGGTNIITLDPMLGEPGMYGGNTRTIPLFSGSSAIDRGNDTNCPATDQRGVTRPQGSHCDIGAYEAPPDTTSPSITSILRAGANPTNASSVNFTVTVSEPVTGVSASDFALHTTGHVSGATITGVTGSNATYTVSVNTGTKNGTLRLDVPASATITDLAGNALGGLPFTTGEAYTLTRNSGADTTGVFRPSNGALYLRNSNTTGFADVQINYGIGGDYPVVGNWNGDGTVTIGIYRNGSFYLRQSNTIGFADVVFPFGAPGDQPVAGDWDGDGVDTIGVYRNGTFLLRNSNSSGAPDMIFALGIPGDVGIAGDWNGDGMDTTGVFRPSNGALYLKNQNTTGFADIQINYGIGGDKPVTGDWDGNGTDTIGIYRNGQFYLRNSNTIGFADLVFALGIPGDHPIAGNWDGLP